MRSRPRGGAVLLSTLPLAAARPSLFPDCSRTLQPRRPKQDGTATATPTCPDSGGHATAWPVTWRYVFSGVWAADGVAANGAALGDTEIGQSVKIMYGVGTAVPGPFPDTSVFPACRAWGGSGARTPVPRVAGLRLGETQNPRSSTWGWCLAGCARRDSNP
jgi:hypothetical protein